MSSIKLTSDTLAVSPAGGELEYNGQFFATDSNNARAQLERLVLETAKSATGTSVDFTGIPSWVKRVTVMFSGVSTSGTSNLLFQLGDSGGVETTGYAAGYSTFSASALTSATETSGFRLLPGASAAAQTESGIIIFTYAGSNLWVGSGSLNRTDSGAGGICNGSKTLSNTLDRIRITTVNGTDTFDAGTINILYEG